jgi:hypothetical protein
MDKEDLRKISEKFLRIGTYLVTLGVAYLLFHVLKQAVKEGVAEAKEVK